MSKQELDDKCFSPNWLELDLSPSAESEEAAVNKEVRLESKQRKT